MASEFSKTPTTLIDVAQIWKVSPELSLVSSYGALSNLTLVKRASTENFPYFEGHAERVWLTIPFAPNGKTEVMVILSCKFEKLALEVWKPSAQGKLELFQGLYNDSYFEKLSQSMRFRVLEGLPGQTFDQAEPVLFETLSRQRGFMRAEAAAQAGLVAGLGIPILQKNSVIAAFSVLISKDTPLMRSIEIWHDMQCTAKLDLFEMTSNLEFVKEVRQQRLPLLWGNRLGLPFIKDSRVRSVLVVTW